jgi:pimeloyl-ACP methyl ester carboxylesterase
MTRRCVVFLPGLLGSVLKKDGREIWGLASTIRSLGQLSESISESLTLHKDSVSEGVTAHMLYGPRVLPGFVSASGYRTVVSRLELMRASTGATVLHFPYDWRQPIGRTASLLRNFLEMHISQFDDTEIFLVGHSLGGLVAEYYAGCYDFEGAVRRVITIGTPFSGALKALEALANPFLTFGPARVRLRDTFRSWPSVAELLPSYPCLEVNDGMRVGLMDSKVLPELNSLVARNVEYRSSELEFARGFEYRPIVGIGQTTHSVAILDEGVVRPIQTLDSDGDGTVPRRSATPAAWEYDDGASFVYGRHAAFQNSRSVTAQLDGILSSKKKVEMSNQPAFRVSADPYVSPSEEWRISVQFEQDSIVPNLFLEITSEEHSPRGVRFEAVDGSAMRTAVVSGLPAGIYNWSIRSAPGNPLVGNIEDVLLCLPE